MDHKNYLKQLNKLSHNISKPNHAFNKHTLPHDQSQPQVYNISKNDFRDMVQKLTGSPGHTPQLKPVASSRLHRLRPPPLPQIVSHRPPQPSVSFGVAPPSPLPPFPSVHAESPVSAYMRFVQSSMTSEWEFQIGSSAVSLHSLGSSMLPLSPTLPVSTPRWTDL